MRRICLSVVLVALCAVATGCLNDPMAKHPRSFQSKLWKEAGVGDTRCDMVDDLRKRVGLVGRTRTDLLQLLGTPAGDGHYHLCPSLADIWILEIHWKDGRVASTTVRDT